MYKVKQVLTLAALTTGVATSLMLASSAGAATVTHQILLPGPPEPFYACSFPLIASFSGTVQMTEIDKNDSVQLIFTPIGPQTITVRSQYGQYAYPADAFTTIFSGLPPFISGGKGQVQIAP